MSDDDDQPQTNTNTNMQTTIELGDLPDDDADDNNYTEKKPAHTVTDDGAYNVNEAEYAANSDDDDDDDDAKHDTNTNTNTNTHSHDDNEEDGEEEGEIDHGATFMALSEFKKKAKKFTKVECVIYFVFLIVFLAMAVMSRGNGDLSYTQTVAIRNPMVTDLFEPWNYAAEKSFVDITTLHEIYNYLRAVAIPLLLRDDRNGTMYVQSQQILLGGVRLRQSRRLTADAGCEKKPLFNAETCFLDDELTEKSVEWGVDGVGEGSYSMAYHSAEALSDQSWRAKYGSYPGGGFYIDLPVEGLGHVFNESWTAAESATATIDFLQSVAWIDAGSRFVVIDFNTYNPSSTLHTVCRVGWEMPSGGVFSTDEFKTWKFDRYTQSSGTTLAVLHVIFIVMLVAMTINTGVQMYKETCWRCGVNPETQQKYYWRVTKWRALDFVNLLFFYCSVLLYIENQSQVEAMDVYSTKEFISFRTLQYTFTLESYFTALNAWLLCLKLFKYFSVNRRLQFLFLIFSRAGYDLLVFCVVLGVFFVAWGTAGFLTFNSDVDDFRSLSFSMGNMLRYTVTEMDYDALNLSSPLWGSTFYFTWSLLMLLVLVNVFIAILSDAYAQVQMDLGDEDTSFGIFATFGKMAQMVSNLKVLGAKHEDIDADGDGIVDLDEFMKHTKTDRSTAQRFFEQFDADNSGGLTKDEFKKAKEELAKKKKQMEKEMAANSGGAGNASPRVRRARSNAGGGMAAESNIPIEEWNDLKKTVTDMQELLVSVLSNTNAGKKALHKRRSSLLQKSATSSNNSRI